MNKDIVYYVNVTYWREQGGGKVEGPQFKSGPFASRAVAETAAAGCMSRPDVVWTEIITCDAESVIEYVRED